MEEVAAAMPRPVPPMIPCCTLSYSGELGLGMEIIVVMEGQQAPRADAFRHMPRVPLGLNGQHALLIDSGAGVDCIAGSLFDALYATTRQHYPMLPAGDADTPLSCCPMH